MSIVGVNQLHNLDKLPLEAKEVLFAYFDKLDQQKELLEMITGLYMVGSVALGDFHADKSDINFVAVLNVSPDRVTQKRLRVIHKVISKMFSIEFNGYYIPEAYLSGKEQENITIKYVRKGSCKTLGNFEMFDVVLYELRQSGISVYGKQVQKLGINVNVEDVITQLHQHLNMHWTKWLRRHRLILPKGWSLLRRPSCTEQGVLGVARQLYTLRSGTIGSKHIAGIYLSRYMKGEYADVIKQATTCRQDKKRSSQWSFLRYTQTRAVIKKTIEAFNKDYDRFQIAQPRQEEVVA